MKRGQSHPTDPDSLSRQVALRRMATADPGGGARGVNRDYPLHKWGSFERRTGSGNFGETTGQKPNPRRLFRAAVRQEGIERHLPGVGNAVGDTPLPPGSAIRTRGRGRLAPRSLKQGALQRMRHN